MSSLAFDDIQEAGFGGQLIADDFQPALHVVQARHYARAQIRSSSNTTDSEEVVTIGGRFTVSF